MIPTSGYVVLLHEFLHVCHQFVDDLLLSLFVRAVNKVLKVSLGLYWLKRLHLPLYIVLKIRDNCFIVILLLLQPLVELVFTFAHANSVE